MEQNKLLSRLEGLVNRFKEISTLITDPSVIADMQRFVRLNKEYTHLGKIVAKRKRVSPLLSNLKKQNHFETENDPEMREMAKSK